MFLVLSVTRCVLRVFSMVIRGATLGKLCQSWCKVRRSTGVRRAARFRVLQGVPRLFTRFRRFSSFFCTFHQEFPCCRVRSLPAFVTFGQLLSCDSPVEGSVHCPFQPFFSPFRPGIPLFKASCIGPSGPPGGIRERSERALLQVEFASVASEL